MSTPLIPEPEQQKQELHSKDEAVALQKLVSAVLDGTETRKPRRRRARMVLPRFQRLQVALARVVRRHPLLFIAVLAGGISMAVLAGREAVSEAGADTNRIVTVLAPGVERPTGSAGAPSGGASPSRSTGSTRLTGSTAKVFRSAQDDVAKGLIVRVTEGDYQRPEDVATGRFLRDFANQWLLLSNVDTTQLLPVRRGKNWVQLVGPYRSLEVDSHRSFMNDDPRRRDTAEQAIMRMVKVKFDKDVATSEEVWKIEHIRAF